MATFLRQNTAVLVQLGPYLDDIDGKTAETALSIPAANAALSKAGGGWGGKNEGTTVTPAWNGWYNCYLNATDTNTLGSLIVATIAAGALPVWREFFVLPAQVYDSIVNGNDYLKVDVTLVEEADPTDQIRDAVFNGVVENSKTFVQMVRGLVAAAFGKSNGLDTPTAVYRDNADTKARITATTDEAGNRSAVTTDLS